MQAWQQGLQSVERSKDQIQTFFLGSGAACFPATTFSPMSAGVIASWKWKSARAALEKIIETTDPT
jgi:hypothetical protein